MAENYGIPRELTKAESAAIKRLKKALSCFPDSLALWEHSGTLLIIGRNKQVFDVVSGVSSNGGDCGSHEIDGYEFLDEITR